MPKSNKKRQKTMIDFMPNPLEDHFYLSRQERNEMKTVKAKAENQGKLLGMLYFYPGMKEIFKLIMHKGGLNEILVKEQERPPDSDDDSSDDEFAWAEKEEKDKPLFVGYIPLDDRDKALVEAKCKELEDFDKTLVALENGSDCNNVELLKEIDDLLIKAGVEDPSRASLCINTGLLKGHFGFQFTGQATQLDQVVKIDGKCFGCSKGSLSQVTIRQLLKQADVPGLDYEDGGEMSIIKCLDCKTGAYLTNVCQSSKFVIDTGIFPVIVSNQHLHSGKFHNHCQDCLGLGCCIRDYRNAHCYACGRHYFAGCIRPYECECDDTKKLIKSARKGDRAALAALFNFDIKYNMDHFNEQEEDADQDEQGDDDA